ncbi:hypothetical protein ACFL0W_02935 [Nanoarchaeota archaeon]
MLNTEDFDRIRTEIDKREKKREQVIIESRPIIKLSKRIISALHRQNQNEAVERVNEIKEKFTKLKSQINKNPELHFIGSFKVACQEYVEALCLFEIITNNKLPNNKDLEVDEEHYLLGLTDLGGELVRLGVNSAIREEYDIFIKIKDFMQDLYEEFLKMDLRNGELRKKFDGMKYDLKKLEELALELKLKDKI